MTINLGTTSINKLYLGSTEIKKTYHGSDLIYDQTSAPGGGSSLSIASASDSGNSLNISGQSTNPQGNYLSKDGLRYFVVDISADKVFQYNLTSANDITTMSYASKSFDVSGQASVPLGVHLNPGMTKMWIIDGSDVIFQYTLSTAGDVSTASYDNKSFSVTSHDQQPQGLFINDTGTRVYVSGGSNESIYTFTLSTPEDITTATFEHSFAFNSEGTIPTVTSWMTVSYEEDVVLIGTTNEIIHQYSMSTPGDVRTLSYDNVSFNVSSFGSQGVLLSVSADYTKMFWGVNNSPETVFEINL